MESAALHRYSLGMTEEHEAETTPAMTLAELRRRRGHTQASLGERLKISRSTVSRVERRRIEDPYLETLADFLGSIGGALQINAAFEDETVHLDVLAG
jgi:transcriptional regulator with XRE-family HTH domain